MGVLGILLLVGGALAGLVGLGGLDLPDVDEEELRRAAQGNDPEQDDDRLVSGNDQDNLLTGGGGADWIIGFDGDDTITGEAGDDVVIPGLGADVIATSTGDDFVEAANIVDETALRDSTASAKDVFDVAFAYDLPGPSDTGDRVDLGQGDDTVVVGSDDTVTGGAGADEFSLGDWIEGGKPAEIEDFDEAEDILTFVYDKQGDAPELSVEVNETTGVTTIKADGQPIAVLRDTSPDFSLRNIAVGRYAA